MSTATTVLIEVKIPHMGSVENATVTQWYKAEGDAVTEDDVICEIQTDKVVTEINAPSAGVLARILAAEGDDTPVGTVIALLADPSAAPDEVAAGLAAYTAGDAALPPHTSDVTPAATPTPPEPVTSRPGQPRPSPLVRRLASEHAIVLDTVTGTGPGGRVTRDDLLGVINGTTSATPPAPTAPAPATPPTAPRPAPAPAVGTSSLPAGYQDVPHDAVPLSAQRRAIADNLATSARTAPQLTADVDVDLSWLSDVRAQLNASRQAGGATKLSFLPFIARAACATLTEHRDLNATYTGSHLVRWEPINLSVAVDSPAGLMVPVIDDAGRFTVTALADLLDTLSAKARDGKLAATDVQRGTFTLSNPGSVGPVERAEAILNPPQVALLGLTAIKRRPVALVSPDGDEYVGIRPILRLSLTFDHRAIDGAPVIRFLTDLKGRLEQWTVEAYL